LDGSIYRFLVENSPDGHFVIVEDYFAYLNGSAMRMFGVAPSDIPGLKVIEIIHPSDRERCLRNVKLRQTGMLKGSTTYLCMRRDASTFPIETHSVALDYQGKVGIHGVIRDITARRTMEKKLERMERATLVSRLASGIAHDFNNLFAVIQSNTDLAHQKTKVPGVQMALSNIRSAVTRGTEKVSQFHRMGAASTAPDLFEPLYLNPIIEEVLDLTKPRWRDEAESEGKRYEIDWQPGTPPPVVGSAGDLQAALVAMVFNALEAQPKGGRITIRTGDDRDLNALITVRDEGEGIAQEFLPRLTDGFYTTREDRQMGLGLSLVQSVLSRHGGRMEVDSEPGRGSTFALILPRSTEAPTSPPPLPRVGLLERPTGPVSVADVPRPKTRSGRTVLLIDDQADLLQVLSNILETGGYAVDTALNGKDGLDLAKVNRYTVVLTDLGMPDMSGFEVAQRIVAMQPTTPVILMTGWAADVDKSRFEEIGVSALLPKPFRREQLLETVAAAIRDAQK
jgi:PAS domain S-box-containing protein